MAWFYLCEHIMKNSRILVNYNFNNKIMPALALHFAYMIFPRDANIHFILIFCTPNTIWIQKKRKQSLRLHQIWFRFSSKLRHFATWYVFIQKWPFPFHFIIKERHREKNILYLYSFLEICMPWYSVWHCQFERIREYI